MDQPRWLNGAFIAIFKRYHALGPRCMKWFTQLREKTDPLWTGIEAGEIGKRSENKGVNPYSPYINSKPTPSATIRKPRIKAAETLCV
jgi:hypothetical protein